MLTQAAHYAYLSKGIVMGQYDTYENESPTIGDLIRGVKTIAVGGFAKAFEQEIVPMEDLLQLQELNILIPMDSWQRHRHSLFLTRYLSHRKHTVALPRHWSRNLSRSSLEASTRI
ncbi:hypothetical protein ACFQH8_21745 [Halomicroarcula sp. GCM10025710]